jgi:predicted MFS family arabinose efflux permease
MGYVAGGLAAGVLADALGFGGAIAAIAGLTAISGLWVAFDLPARPHVAATQSVGASRSPVETD